MTNKEYYKAYREKNREKYNLRRKEWRKKNKEILKSKEREYCEKNKDKIKIRTRKYRLEHKLEIFNKKVEYAKKNKEAIRKYQKEYRDKNKEKIKAYRVAYYKNNKKDLINKNIKYTREKRQNDPIFRIASCLRARLRAALKYNLKTGSAIKDLGCTVEELKLYLESLFQPGMSWDNYGNKEGNWSIDHIIPLSRVDLEDREQFLKVNHYTNLQPLWHVDNMKKGNKLPEKELNKYY